jgi:hypothetical protein
MDNILRVRSEERRVNWLSKLLRKSGGGSDPLVVVPIPPLVTLLQHQEMEKGSPLTESEVVAIRDGAICMTMSSSRAANLAASLGFADIDPAEAWEEWVRVRPLGAP